MRLPIKIKFKHRNRTEKKLLLKEMSKIYRHLDPIEVGFYEAVLVSETEESYEEIYRSFKEKWDKVMEFLKTSNKFNYTNPDDYYFHDLYLPVKKEGKFFKFNQWLRKKLS